MHSWSEKVVFRDSLLWLISYPDFGLAMWTVTRLDCPDGV